MNVGLLVAFFAVTYAYSSTVPRPLDVILMAMAGVLAFPLGLCLVALPGGTGPSSLTTVTVVAITLCINAFVWGHLAAGLWTLLRREWLSPAERIRARGLCPSCGYDLRATPDRCPECGTAVGPSDT